MLFVLFFVLRNKLLHIGSGIAIIILLFELGANTLIILLVSLLLIGTSINWLFGRSTLIGAILGLILIIPLSTMPIMADHTQGHTGTSPEGYEELPDMIIEIRELAGVRRITDQPKMNLLGTEYLPFDEGKLQAFISQGEFPIDDAACYASILFQNESYFLKNVLMTPVNKTFFEGLYTYDFIVPNITGIYPVMAHCFYNVSTITDYVQDTTGNYTLQAGSINDLQILDNNSLELQAGSACNNAICERFFEFDLPAGFNTPFLNDIRLFLYADAQDAKNFNFSVFNGATGLYEEWLTITKNGPNDEVLHQLQIQGNYSVNNTITVRLRVYDGTGNRLDIDLLRMIRNYNGTNLVDLRQNQELVVSQRLTNATNLIIAPPDQEIISGEQTINILLLIGIIISAISGTWIITSLLIMIWVIFYSTNIYITITFLLLGIYTLYRAKIQQK